MFSFFLCFRVALFRLFAWRYFVLLHGVISSFRVASFVFSHGVILSFRVASFRGEKTKRRHAKRRHDEITPSEKTKRRHAKSQKDATRKDDKIKVSNGVFSQGVFCLFLLNFRLFAWRFRLFEWRLFIFLPGISPFFAFIGMFFFFFVFSQIVFSPPYFTSSTCST